MIGCLLGVLLLGLPRVALLVVRLATGWFDEAYESTIWPILGWLFLPWTTAAYMAAMLHNDHEVSGGWIVVIVLAVLADLGSSGSSRFHARRTVTVRRRDD